MVTTQNYFDTILRIDWNTVPDSLKKTRDTLIPDAARNDWKIYNNDEDVRRVVEKYFGYIGRYVAPPKSGKPVTDVSERPSKKAAGSILSDETRKEAHALATDLIRSYVLRGDTYESLKKSYLGRSIDGGSAMIKSDKIIVDRIGNASVNVFFSLRSIFNEIKKESGEAVPLKAAKRSGKTKSVSDLPEPKQVTHIPTSTTFIRRYAALHGKVKTRDQILSLVHGLQKAITEQRITKTNPAIGEIEKMQHELIALAGSMGETAKIEIDEPSLAHYDQIAKGEEVRTSVRLLKSFISMNGKAYEKKKAAALQSKMEKALHSIPKEDAYLPQLSTAMKALASYGEGKDKTISIPTAALHGLGGIATGYIAGLGTVPGSGEGAIIRLLRAEGVKSLSEASLKKAFRRTVAPSLCLEIARSLIRRRELTMDVISSPHSKKQSNSLSGIDSVELAGDGRITDLDILDMRLSGSRSAGSGLGSTGNAVATAASSMQFASTAKPAPQLQMQTAVPVSAKELAKMRFETIGYKGRFKDVVGDPAMGFHMMVYGKPFQGKSSFVIELCKDLTHLGKGKVAYLALEEGISASMQKKIIDRQADNIDGLDFLGAMPASFEGYCFVVIDSVSDRAIKRDTLRELFLRYSTVCFICIFHATKSGSARGGLDYSHDMDVIIRIDNHKPFVEKNRFL